MTSLRPPGRRSYRRSTQLETAAGILELVGADPGLDPEPGDEEAEPLPDGDITANAFMAKCKASRKELPATAIDALKRLGKTRGAMVNRAFVTWPHRAGRR